MVHLKGIGVDDELGPQQRNEIDIHWGLQNDEFFDRVRFDLTKTRSKEHFVPSY